MAYVAIDTTQRLHTLRNGQTVLSILLVCIMLHSNDLDRAFVTQVLRGLCSSWLLAHTRIVFPHAVSSSLIWLWEVLLELGGRGLCWLEEFRRPRLQKLFLNRNLVLAPLEVFKHGHIL